MLLGARPRASAWSKAAPGSESDAARPARGRGSARPTTADKAHAVGDLPGRRMASSSPADSALDVRDDGLKLVSQVGAKSRPEGGQGHHQRASDDDILD